MLFIDIDASIDGMRQHQELQSCVILHTQVHIPTRRDQLIRITAPPIGQIVQSLHHLWMRQDLVSSCGLLLGCDELGKQMSVFKTIQSVFVLPHIGGRCVPDLHLIPQTYCNVLDFFLHVDISCTYEVRSDIVARQASGRPPGYRRPSGGMTYLVFLNVYCQQMSTLILMCINRF